MTPKEKAKALYESFAPNVRWKLGQEDYKDRAKRCAVIVVEEMIEYLTTSTDVMTSLDSVKYWNEVKQEIAKI